jgi:2-(1,2-epoxy-1,2-dihydrophenyl)acetyl-CoA isomerase
MADLIETRNEAVLTLTLNRPDRMNAFSDEMLDMLAASLRSAAADETIRAIILTGAGRGFCAGGDVKTMGDRSARVFEERAAGILRSGSVAMMLHSTPKPIIGMINGVAVGAGLSMAAACDMRVAARSARFGTGFIKIGLSGDWGGTWSLTRLIGTAKARELFFTGDMIGADEALRIGLVNQVAEDADLLETTMIMAKKIAAMPRVGLGYTKKNLNAAEVGEFATVLDMEAFHQARCSQTEDHREAVEAFREKRRPVFKGR